MIKIRKANRDDFEALEELYTELEKDAVMYQSEHFVLSPKGARSRQLEEILASENQVMLVAEDDGKVIGFAHVMLQKAKVVSCLKPQTNIYLQDLVVTSTLRSKGTGTQLLNAAKEYGREKGAEFFRTQVFPMNKDGMRFYERNGFSTKMITIECDL
ncbi:MAG: GNAT family N-acetyltransferase [Treponema sp.]|nr:GNAT family N-acetyltransferase [Treponema sp.]MBR6294967.1 GNAT family N-acetyltransferase [Treponema sp.]